jgi:purine-binding chemotaxis protein CheW
VSERELHARAGELRRNFDRAFAHPETTPAAAQLELLLIRVRGHDYALRLDQVGALHEGRKLVAVPSPRPELRGLLGVRGQVTPVYDLGLLLGHAPGPAGRWVVLARGTAPFGVAFEHFEAYLRVPFSAMVAQAADATSPQRFATASVTSADGARPLIDLAALVADVTGSRRQGASEREERR